jgi:hypothetical protein
MQASAAKAGAETDTTADRRRPLPGLQDHSWHDLLARFLAAVPGDLRAAVEAQVRQPRYGGLGLRSWLHVLHAQGRALPPAIPAVLIRVYLSDPEAAPLHDCESCGLAVPVRPGAMYGHDGEPERVYFSSCPLCGGRTGLYAFWSRTQTIKGRSN